MARKKATAPATCSLTIIVENPEGHRLIRQRVKIMTKNQVELELRTDAEGQAYFEKLPRGSHWKVFVNGTDTGETVELEQAEEELEIEHEHEESHDGEDEEANDEEDLDSTSDEDEL